MNSDPAARPDPSSNCVAMQAGATSAWCVKARTSRRRDISKARQTAAALRHVWKAGPSQPTASTTALRLIGLATPQRTAFAPACAGVNCMVRTASREYAVSVVRRRESVDARFGTWSCSYAGIRVQRIGGSRNAMWAWRGDSRFGATDATWRHRCLGCRGRRD
jgi:hypothetical protein